MGKHTRHSRSDVGLRRYDAESERFETYAEQSQWRTQADSPDITWKLFAASARRSPAARRALRAFRERERVVRMAEAKFEETARVLRMFPGEQAVLFCGGTDVAMEVSRRLAIPLIAASTPASERHAILGAMRDGTLRAVASVKVLDEGWDVPNAKLGIVLSDAGQPQVFRNGKAHDWKDHWALYAGADGAKSPIALGWKQGVLTVAAGGATFTGTMKDGVYRFENR